MDKRDVARARHLPKLKVAAWVILGTIVVAKIIRRAGDERDATRRNGDVPRLPHDLASPRLTKITAYSTVVVAAATVGLLINSYLQWTVMKDTLLITERAELYVTGFQLKTDATENPRIRYSLLNSGASPAILNAIHFKRFIGEPLDDTARYEEDPLPRTGQTVPPGARTATNLEHRFLGEDGKRIKDLALGWSNEEFFFAIMIEYTDIFDTARTFCTVVTLSTDVRRELRSQRDAQQEHDIPLVVVNDAPAWYCNE